MGFSYLRICVPPTPRRNLCKNSWLVDLGQVIKPPHGSALHVAVRFAALRQIVSHATYINQSGNFAQISRGVGGVTNPLIGRTLCNRKLNNCFHNSQFYGAKSWRNVIIICSGWLSFLCCQELKLKECIY